MWSNFALIFGALLIRKSVGLYEANWSSIDSRPLPLWYDEAKFGIFTHWGVYSVPAWEDEWFWWYWRGSNGSSVQKSADEFVEKHYPPGTTYPDFASDFTAVDFDANAFAGLVKASGAKYFVLTTKHHEGFTLWDSPQQWNWNAKDVGPGRNLVEEIREAILNVGGVHWGTYFSLMEWFNPYFIEDQFTHGHKYPDEIAYPQLIDLVTRYQPDLIWSDGVMNSFAKFYTNSSYWRATEFLAWLYNESPVKDVVVVNDRWGVETTCKHGGYYTCEDRYNPGKLQQHKWENVYTVDMYSWGFRRSMTLESTNSLYQLLKELITTIATGGNFLLNIGPDHNGRILPIFEERLQDIGAFVGAHEEAIFSTKPWIYQNDSSSVIWYTSRLRDDSGFDPYRFYNPQQENNTIIYAFTVQFPEDNLVNLPHILPTAQTKITLFGANSQNISLGYTQPLDLEGGIRVDISGISLKKFPSNLIFALKIEYAADQDINPLK